MSFNPVIAVYALAFIVIAAIYTALRKRAEARSRATKAEAAKIGHQDVEIEHKGRRMKIKNDAVIVCALGILPTAFLKSVGIEVETKYGTA